MSQATKHKTELHWRYRFLEKLGQGGEGEVYLAEDRLTGRPAVVKVSARNSGPDLRLEFIRLYRMDHPGLLKAFDFYRQDERSLAAFEHFPGATLDDYIRQNRPDKKELWNIWVRLAGITAYLHGREYTHGDIKPGNILIGQDGRVKLIDLGLARKTGDEQSSGFTGTAEYSAPEVLNGGTGPSQSSDVYSLGLLLFWMMTGQLPAAKDRLEENQSWSLGLKDSLDDKRSEIGIRALNYWPQERYHSAPQLFQALRHSGSGCGLEGPGSFRFSVQNQALAKAVEHLHSGRSGLFTVTAGPGRGKTAFLRELNFICQMAGQSSAYLNAAETEGGKPFNVVPSDSVLLIDGLKDGEIPGWLKERPGPVVAAIDPSNRRFSQTGHTQALEKFQKQEYSKVLAGYLAGLSSWELENLSNWVWRQAGGNIAHARSYLEHCQTVFVISQKQDHWQIDWQKMFAGQNIPEETAADIGRRWNSLNAESREALKKICLEGGAGSRQKTVIPDPDYWLDDSGRVDGDILRTFILEQIDPFKIDEIKIQAKPSENPSVARWMFWDKTNNRQNWLSEGRGLFIQAQADNDLEKMLYVGQLLVDSGQLEANEQIKTARLLVTLYPRLSRWALAIELWKTLAEPLSGEWEYHQVLAKLFANKGEYVPALETLEAGVQTIKDAGQQCLYLAYKGWVLGLQGKTEEGRAVLELALETADGGQCTGYIYFEIYNSLARHNQLLNDFKQVAFWAQKAVKIEIPDTLKKAELLNLAGYSLWQTGNLVDARTYLENSISLLEQEGQNNIFIYVLCNLGHVNVSLKDFENAIICFQRADSYCDFNFDLELKASIIGNIAFICELLGQINIAKEKYLDSYKSYNEIDNKQGMMISMSNAALQDQTLGNTDYSLKVLAHCLSLSQKYDLDFVTVIILKDIGTVNVESDRHREGLDNIEKSVSLASASGKKINWDCIYYGALAAGGLNDLRKMNDYLILARDQAGDETEKAQLKMLEGFYMAKNGDLKKGLDLAMESAGELKDSGDPAESAKVWLKTGELAMSSDEFNNAEKLMPGLLAAEAQFQKMGAPVYLERTRKTILAAVQKLFAPGNIMPGTQMLEGLYQIAALLDPGKNQAELAQNCLDVAVKLLKAERGGLFLMDENSKLFLAAKTDLDPDTQHDALEFSSNAVMAAASGETMVVSNDAQLDEDLSSRLSVKRNAIRSLLCLPLRSREGTLGAIYLDSRLKPGIFNQAQRDFTKALAQILGAVIESHRLFEELRSKSREHQVAGSKAMLGMIGNSAAVKSMIKRIKAAAPTDVTVLLDGESGTGKEMAAQIVHQLSARKDGKFLALDCGSLPETLLESELFGYVKGSFTGANKDKTGLFEAADGGTVFLDEIASASPGVQARLLRVIEAGEIRRIGSDAVSRVDVRMICATNKDLEIEINEGRFREDLYYRLKGIKIDIPPLRERGDDVLILAEYFKNRFQKKHNKGRLAFTEEARRSIIINSWPGNIRELENTIQKAVLLAQGKTITGKDLEIDGYYPESGQTFKQELNSTQKEKILRILDATENNYTKAAKIYGVTVRHFYRLLAKFGINRDINVKQPDI